MAKEEKLNYSSEKNKKKNNTEKLVESKKTQRVLSKINLEDNQNIQGGFSIKVGEIKHLPIDYEKSNLIKECLKRKDLILINEKKEKKDSDVTLDLKDVANFLNQNTLTVIKQLKINNLSKKDLQSLLAAERKSKNRKKIIDFIKTLKKVS